ncbi:MAG: NADPH-dependent glutamate synthase [Clostridia bacterium]
MAVSNNQRIKMPVQDALVRSHNFNEVSLGLDKEMALREASRCLNCKTPLCVQGCPVNVNIPKFIQFIKEDNIEGAATSLKIDNVLSSICGRVCPQESQCEKYCIRGVKGESVAIGALERYVGDFDLFENRNKDVTKVLPNGKKVAVVGSGPSSLSCASELAMAGFDVTIYEAFHKAGGVLVYGIPEFRLPKDLVQKVIENLMKMGVKFMFNSVIGRTITLEELREDSEAVFIGTGAGLPSFLKIKGENLNGVYSANEYLTRVNLMKAYLADSKTPIQRGKNVVVVGAGNVAMDSARTALRMGADNVYLVYRRGREEMPAREEEIIHAQEEGIQFNLLTNPVEILGENGRVVGMKCIKMELGEPDKSGRRRPLEIVGSEFVFSCDQIIVALGTSPNPLIRKTSEGIDFTNKGTIIANEITGETTLENVYAGGDAVTGAATVILAMGAGKRAAKAIIDKNN